MYEDAAKKVYTNIDCATGDVWKFIDKLTSTKNVEIMW
jgi:ribosome recycling factor